MDKASIVAMMNLIHGINSMNFPLVKMASLQLMFFSKILIEEPKCDHQIWYHSRVTS